MGEIPGRPYLCMKPWCAHRHCGSSTSFQWFQLHVDLYRPAYMLARSFFMVDITAETCTSTFVSGWFARFWVPATITSDRGCQFESSLWEQLTLLLGIQHIHTTAYHPITNGMVEKLHHQLKAALKTYPAPERWTKPLPIVLLGICTVLKENDLHCTAAEVVYGTTPRLPGELFTPSVAPSDPSSYCLPSNLRCNSYMLHHHDLYNALHMLVPNFPLAHTYLSGMMPRESHFNCLMMGYTWFSRAGWQALHSWHK